MKLKSGIFSLSERLKWKNWPTWLKGFFLLWPSLGPAYLFITRTPGPSSGDAELSTIMTNIEYQNYFIVVFIGFWSINLILLGMTWIIGGLVSDGYRSLITDRSNAKKTTNIAPKTPTGDREVPGKIKRSEKRYPVLVKKRARKDISGKRKTAEKTYPVLTKKDSSAGSTK